MSKRLNIVLMITLKNKMSESKPSLDQFDTESGKGTVEICRVERWAKCNETVLLLLTFCRKGN